MPNSTTVNFDSLSFGFYIIYDMYIASRRFLHNHGNIATEGSRSGDYALLLFRMTSRVLYSAHYHRQHCTLRAFEQFGALYMHNNDNKYPARPGFEPDTPRLQALVDMNESLWPARILYLNDIEFN